MNYYLLTNFLPKFYSWIYRVFAQKNALNSLCPTLCAIKGEYIFFVSGPPVISVPRTYYSVSLGSSVTFEINVTSSLNITDLFWEKYNSTTYIYEPIDVQSESRLNGGNITCPSLTITDVNKNDFTYFRVKATNSDGTSTTYIFVSRVFSMYL